MAKLESLEFEIKAKSNDSAIDITTAKMEKLNKTVDENTEAYQKLQKASTITYTYKDIPGQPRMPKIIDTDTGAAGTQADQIAQYQNTFNQFMSDAQTNASRLQGIINSVDMNKLVAQAQQSSNVIDEIKEHVKGVKLTAGEVAPKISTWSKLMNATKSTTNKVSNGFKKVKNVIGNVTSTANKLKGAIKSATASSSKMFSSNAIGKIKRFTLALVGARSAFTAVRKAVSSYLAYDTQLSAQIENDWAVLGSLLAPILEYVISLFTKAVSIIATFIKALTGIDLVARANTKALNATNKAAKSTLGNLAKFDELNTVDFNDNSSNDLTPLTIEDVDVSPLLQAFNKLKEYNWYGIGMEIGKLFNDGLSNLDLDKWYDKITSFGTKFGDLFNGLVDGVDWNKLGDKVGKGLNIITGTVNNFLNTADFTNFGTGLGEMLSSSISNINWKQLAETTVNLGTTPFDFIIGLFENIDWGEVAKSVGTYITSLFNKFAEWLKNVDWVKVGESLAGFICDTIENLDVGKIVAAFIIFNIRLKEALLKVLWGFIKGLAEDAYKKTKEELEGKDWKEIGLWCLKGLFEAMTGITIGKLVWEKLVKPLIDAVKDDLGIHSPSTVFMEIGQQLIDGLVLGIGNIWDKVKTKFETFKTNVKTKCNDIGITIGDTIGSSVRNAFSALLNKLVDKINGFIDSVNKAITYINKLPGVSVSKISRLQYPALATGTNKIEYEGLYHLHEGEAVVPKKYNPAINKDTGSEEVAQKLETLIKLIGDMDVTNNVYVGNERLYSGTVKYIKKQNNIYGTNAIKI